MVKNLSPTEGLDHPSKSHQLLWSFEDQHLALAPFQQSQ